MPGGQKIRMYFCRRASAWLADKRVSSLESRPSFGTLNEEYTWVGHTAPIIRIRGLAGLPPFSPLGFSSGLYDIPTERGIDPGDTMSRGVARFSNCESGCPLGLLAGIFPVLVLCWLRHLFYWIRSMVSYAFKISVILFLLTLAVLITRIEISLLGKPCLKCIHFMPRLLNLRISRTFGSSMLG